MRVVLISALVCVVVVLAASLVGRAIDNEQQTRVIVTRGGQTLDCRRDVSATGEVDYNDCNTVP